MAIGDTSEPVGAPSLTEQEIIFLYQKYFGRSPDGNELASEKQNALKYSAAGIERQIANRAGNTAGSGVRGDEGLPSLTVPYVPPPIFAPAYIPSTPPFVYAGTVGNGVTMGPSATTSGPIPAGPTGLMYPSAPGAYNGGYYAGAAAGSLGIGGLSMTTLVILGAMAAAALYFLRR